MSDRDRTADENAALRARISALSAASLRINASLDLETVLNEVVDSARALTGARYGAIATIDDAGVPQDFVTSGFTAEEHRKLVEWPDGPRLFEYFRDLPGPLRLADVPDYVRSLGFSTDRLPVVPASASPPHVTLTVTRPSSPEGRPVMEASIAGIAALDDTDLLEQAAAEAGDLERCVAWAWLSNTPQ